MGYELKDNYIYFYHTNNFIVIPTQPESISDTLSANFNQTSILSRSAPIFTYSNSGPRSMQISFHLHREMMQEINYGKSNFNINFTNDYVDVLVKELQAMALPRYDANTKLVDPPIIAVRFGNEVFIKGVVTGGITVTYSGPILSNQKYALVDISFNISEIDPIDALTIQSLGSWRPIPKTLERRIYKS